MRNTYAKNYANVTQIQQWSSCNVSDDWMSKNAILVFRGLFFINFLFLCGTAALGSHLAEGAVTYALYIGAVEQGAQLVVYGTLLDAQAVAQFLGFCRSELRDGHISWNYE